MPDLTLRAYQNFSWADDDDDDWNPEEHQKQFGHLVTMSTEDFAPIQHEETLYTQLSLSSLHLPEIDMPPPTEDEPSSPSESDFEELLEPEGYQFLDEYRGRDYLRTFERTQNPQPACDRFLEAFFEDKVGPPAYPELNVMQPGMEPGVRNGYHATFRWFKVEAGGYRAGRVKPWQFKASRLGRAVSAEDVVVPQEKSDSEEKEGKAIVPVEYVEHTPTICQGNIVKLEGYAVISQARSYDDESEILNKTHKNDHIDLLSSWNQQLEANSTTDVDMAHCTSLNTNPGSKLAIDNAQVAGASVNMNSTSKTRPNLRITIPNSGETSSVQQVTSCQITDVNPSPSQDLAGVIEEPISPRTITSMVHSTHKTIPLVKEKFRDADVRVKTKDISFPTLSTILEDEEDSMEERNEQPFLPSPNVHNQPITNSPTEEIFWDADEQGEKNEDTEYPALGDIDIEDDVPLARLSMKKVRNTTPLAEEEFWDTDSKKKIKDVEFLGLEPSIYSDSLSSTTWTTYPDNAQAELDKELHTTIIHERPEPTHQGPRNTGAGTAPTMMSIPSGQEPTNATPKPEDSENIDQHPENSSETRIPRIIFTPPGSDTSTPIYTPPGSDEQMSDGSSSGSDTPPNAFCPLWFAAWKFSALVGAAAVIGGIYFARQPK